MTAVGGVDRDSAIEWRTYTPDGRSLTVRRANGGWTASCEGHEAERPSLTEAIRDAIAGGAQLLRPEPALESWIEETAAHIVGDTMQ